MLSGGREYAMLASMRSKLLKIIPVLRAFVAAAVLLVASGAPLFAAPVVFPAVEGVNLNNAAQVLPGDFKGRLNLVLMAFKREQQAEIDTWLPEIRQLASGRPGLAYYELPVIGPKVAPLRWIIRKGMGSKIKAPEARARTILVFSEKAPLLKALEVGSEETIAVLLLDDSKRLLWRSHGPWDEQKGEALRQQVVRILSKPRGGRHE